MAALLTALTLGTQVAPAAFAARSEPRHTDASGEVKAEKSLGGLRYTIMVRKFADEAAWPNGYTLPSDNTGGLGNAYSTVLENALQDEGHFIVVAGKEMSNEAMDEQQTSADSGAIQQGKKTPVKGHMAPAQLLVRGSITRIAPDKSFMNLDQTHSILNFNPTKLFGSFRHSKTEIDVTVQVVDASTRIVLASKTVTGKTSANTIDFWNVPIVHGVNFGTNKDLMGAVVRAVNQSVQFLVEELPKVEWQGTVVSVDGAEVLINRGSREGVQEGNQFTVGEVETIRDPDTGEVLKEKMTRVGVLKVTDVDDKTATCKVVKSSAPIGRGMAVHPLLGEQD